MGRRTQLNPQSRIHRKSSSRNSPSFLNGKYFIQSGSVEKDSIKLNPYHFGLIEAAPGADFSRPMRAGGNAPAAAIPAKDFKTLRRSVRERTSGCLPSPMFVGPLRWRVRSILESQFNSYGI